MKLWMAAEQRWKRCCPCCGVNMRSGRGLKRGRPMPTNVKTDGHDIAVSRGGDARIWLAICYGCNNDQGWLSFVDWARVLYRAGDKRAQRVHDVARFIEHWMEHHWRKSA